MSAVAGPGMAPNTSSASSTKPGGDDGVEVNNVNSNKANHMSSSEPTTAARVNGNQLPAAEAVVMETSSNTIETGGSASGDVKEEPTANINTNPLPADLKRILGEVARTGTCSWLAWSFNAKDNKNTASNYDQALAASSTNTTGGMESVPSSTIDTNNAVNGGKPPTSSLAASNNHNIHTKYALGIPSSNRRPYTSTHSHSNRPPHFAAGAAVGAAGVPKATRKKHRNGVKMNRIRRQVQPGDGGSKTQTGTTSSGSRKRPLFLIRTSAAGAAAAGAAGGTTASASSVFSPGSVGSGRTSGSEPDDSTQYECDSEGTSATSCSELSTERRDHHLRNMQRVAIPASKKPPPSAVLAEDRSSAEDYRCLRDVFRMALDLVLDHWYRNKGGYRLSWAEKRRCETASSKKPAAKPASPPLPSMSSNTTPMALVNGDSTSQMNAVKNEPQPDSSVDSIQNGPQQDASATSDVTANTNEPLSAPATYNTEIPKKLPPPSQQQQQQQQSNKEAFRPSVTAEDIFHQRRQRLLMMLGQANDRYKLNPSSMRSRFQAEDEGPPFTIQRIAEVLIAPERYYTQTHKLCNCLEKLLLVTSSTSAFGGSTGGITSQSRLEERELAALADEKGRLETEFRQRALKRRNSALSDDLHLGTGGDNALRLHGSPSRDHGHPSDPKNNELSPEQNPNNDSESSSREMLEAAARSLRTKFDHVGIDPHSSAVANRDVHSIAENRGMTNSPPPPSLSMAAAGASNIALPGHTAVGNFVRQHHPEQNAEHASIARVPSPILFSQGNEPSSIGPLHAPPNMQLLHMHHGAPLAGVSMGSTHGSTPFDVVTIQAGGGGPSAPHATGLTAPNEGADLEGRSSASNSDVDSESDDVSFDDSASDRSDGSDSGHIEPFTAARAMALNRIQQQQRLQNRGGLLTSLALHQSEGGFRPPADSEYQSGDSIDSTRGEDSGGSDSSSSDVAD